MIPSGTARTRWQWQPEIDVKPAPFPILLETRARYSGVRTPLAWSGCDDGDIETGGNPLGRTVAAIGNAVNHLQGQTRLLFCQAITDSDSPTTTKDPLFSFLFSERMPQGTERVWTALCLPQSFPVAATPPVSEFGRSPGGPFGRGNGYASSASSPDDLVEVAFVESGIVVGNRWRELEALVRNGFRLVGLTVYERPRADGCLDVTLDVFRPVSVGAGGPITERPLHAIRRALNRSWRWGRGTYCGSLIGEGTPSAARVTGTTKANIFDITSTSRTASTPGVLVDALYGAQDRDTEADAFVAVKASITGGSDGAVDFVSSQNTVTISGIGTTVKWYRAAMTSPLQLDATATGRAAVDGAASDKVDILAAAGTAGQSIDVFAWSIIPCGRLT